MTPATQADAPVAPTVAQQHANNLAHTQRLLARAGGWPLHEGPGWVAADGLLPSRFFAAGVLTDRRLDPGPTIEALRAGGTWRPDDTGAIVFDTWGRPGTGDCATVPLMVRPAGPFGVVDDRVQVARDVAGLRLVEQALAAALDHPPFRSLRPGSVLGAGLLASGLAAAVGVVDGAPCAVALAVDDGTTVGVYLVGVAPGHRRTGLGAAVTAAAVGALAPRSALLTATRMGRGTYERLGWRAAGQATLWRVPRPPRSR